MSEIIRIYWQSLVAEIIVFAPRLAFAILLLFGGLWLSNYLTRVFGKIMVRRGLDASLQPFLLSLASGSLKVLLLVTVAGVLGLQTTSFVAIIGAAGLAVGLALQGSLSNFAGGVLTLVFKPYKVGEIIEAQGHLGQVKEIQIFNTILLTTDYRTVILPNGAVSNGTIVNFSKQGFLRLEIPLSLSPDTDLNSAREVLLEACMQNPMVLAKPAPTVAVIRVDNGIHVSLRPYVDPKNYWDAMAEINEQAHEALQTVGIREPIPEYAIYQR